MKLQGLRLELEKGKVLLELAQKRELKKKELLAANREVFDSRVQQRREEVS